MVAEGAEISAFRICSLSSMLVLLERGLEGTLADLRWQAMARIEAEIRSFYLEMEEKIFREVTLLQWR